MPRRGRCVGRGGVTKALKLSAAAARRIAIAAQGLDKARPAKPTRRHVEQTLKRLGVLQIDAVNVVARAHYMPLFSRLGPYDTALLDAVWLGKKRCSFEYWGHEASILPHDAHALFRWRMEGAVKGEDVRGYAANEAWMKYAKENRAYLDAVRAELRDRGPLRASELSDAGARQGPWWGWSDGKRAMEYLFRIGEVTTSTRRGFERVYDFSERVLPGHIHTAPTPSRADAIRMLAARALDALGVATVGDVKDYYRLRPHDAKQAMGELVEAGAALPVEVEGWRDRGYLAPSARTPRRIEAAALLNPFDPLIWRRERVQRLFGFDYTIEIYVPQAKRVYGYYVLPFLLGEQLAARVDLKADRAGDALLVQAAHLEPGADKAAVADALAQELDAMRGWLGLARLSVARRGDLAAALAKAARAPG